MRAALMAWRKDWSAVLSILADHRPEEVVPLMEPQERRRVLAEMEHVREYLADLERVLR